MELHWKDSLKVLRHGLPEPQVVEVVGKACAVKLYQWARPTGEMKCLSGIGYDYMMLPKTEPIYAHTCEQAHAEANGAPVSVVDVIRVGKSYFLIGDLKAIKPLPKPRVS